MNSDFATVASMAVGVLLSPEVWLLGLWLASIDKQGAQKAWLYCAGGTLGLLTSLALGFFLALVVSAGPSWGRFFIRAGLGIALISSGIYVIIKNKKFDQARYSQRVTLSVATGLGFFATGLNLKVISIAASAGRKISEAGGELFHKAGALVIFLSISVIPLIAPAILKTIRPNLGSSIMAPCNRLLEKYGRWIAAAILFTVGGIFLKGAFKVMP